MNTPTAAPERAPPTEIRKATLVIPGKPSKPVEVWIYR
jgi:hypothetical protein